VDAGRHLQGANHTLPLHASVVAHRFFSCNATHAGIHYVPVSFSFCPWVYGLVFSQWSFPFQFPLFTAGFYLVRIPCFSLPLATPVSFFSLRLVAVDNSVQASSLQHSLQRLVMINQVHHSTARLVVE